MLSLLTYIYELITEQWLLSVHLQFHTVFTVRHVTCTSGGSCKPLLCGCLARGMSNAYLRTPQYPPGRGKRQPRILQEMVRDPGYLHHFAMEPSQPKEWDSRHHLGRLPGYDAMSDRYCKWHKKKRQVLHRVLPPAPHC